MRNFKLTVAYDGTNYFGWRVQANKATVQETLEAAVEQITGRKVRLHASGRTDAGVHALGQVASFQCDTNLESAVLQKALNAVLPEDVAVLDVCEVPADFHPRYSAQRKHYRYLLYDGEAPDIFLRRYAWHYKNGRLDADAMHRAAQSLVGKHNFTSFESSGAKRKTSIRTIFSLNVRRGRAGEGGAVLHPAPPLTSTSSQDWITLDIIADGFLYNMVRSILGTLVEVGRGAQSKGWPAEVLLAADRRRAGPTAPPQGLFLMKVCYAEDA
jgi:tRNA pseudouridine38-40 synthase